MTQDSIIVVAKAADRMCDDGILSDAQCARSAELYAQIQDVYKKALEAELFFIEATISGSDGSGYREEKTRAVHKLIDLGLRLREIVDDEH